MIGDQISVITKAHGSVSNQYSPPTDGGVMAVIDPKARVIGMCLYMGLFTIIPLDKETSELKATHLRYVYKAPHVIKTLKPQKFSIFLYLNYKLFLKKTF